MKTKLFLIYALALCVIALVACEAPAPTAAPPLPTSTLTSVPPILTPPAATSPTLDPFRGVAPSATQASFANPASFRKLPYLVYTGNNTSMTVMWQTKETPAMTRIEWGDTEAYQGGQANVVENKDGPDDHQFAYTIREQKPGARVFYRVTVDGKSNANSFVIPPARDAQSVVFYAYGDTRTYPSTHNDVLFSLLRDVNKNSSARQTFLLHAGDYVTWGLSETNWDREYFNPLNQYLSSGLASIPMIGALGNHEEYLQGSASPVCSRAGEVFRKYFPYPMYVDPRHFYYSFDYGPVHVAVIDPYTSDYTKETGEQYKWLKQDLSQPRPFKIMLMHPPAWSNNGSGFALRQNLHELFKASGVSLVLQGHEHYYSRFMVDGIPYLTVGGGGAPLESPGFFNPDVYNEKEHSVSYTCVDVPFVGNPKLPAVTLVDTKKAARELHFARIEIASGKMTVTVLNVEGKIIDCIPDDATCTP